MIKRNPNESYAQWKRRELEIYFRENPSKIEEVRADYLDKNSQYFHVDNYDVVPTIAELDDYFNGVPVPEPSHKWAERMKKEG